LLEWRTPDAKLTCAATAGYFEGGEMPRITLRLGGTRIAICFVFGCVAAIAMAESLPASNGLKDPAKKEIAMELVSSAENSSLDWKAQYGYIEYNVEKNEKENRGYTGGIIGFTSKTHDMLELVEYYDKIAPGNVLEKYLPSLRQVDGTSSKKGLGKAFIQDWKSAGDDPKFREAQDHERDRVYFNPAVEQAQRDGLHTLGQFIYYDAIVMYGDGMIPQVLAASGQPP
jgi:chitosanase